jgi:enterochelin esterase-like enzyme
MSVSMRNVGDRLRRVCRPRLTAMVALVAMSLWSVPGHAELREDPSASSQVATASDCGFKGVAPDRVRFHRHWSPGLSEAFCVAVRTPPSGVTKSGDYPVIVLLHGYGGTPADWFTLASTAQVLDDAMKDGRLPPSLVIAPTGASGYWTNWTDGAHPYADLVTKGIWRTLSPVYPLTDDPRLTAVMGLSMGGFGALSIGLRHPERFGVLVGLSPTDMLIAVEDQPKRKLYRNVFGTPPDRGAVMRVNPFHLVREGRGIGQLVLLAWGDAESRKFAEGGAHLRAALKGAGVTHQARVVAGGRHSYANTWSLETQRWWVSALASRWSAPSTAP